MTPRETYNAANRLYSGSRQGPQELMAAIANEFHTHVLGAGDLTFAELEAVVTGNFDALGQGYGRVRGVIRQPLISVVPWAVDALRQMDESSRTASRSVPVEDPAPAEAVEDLSQAFADMYCFFHNQIGKKYEVTVAEVVHPLREWTGFRVTGPIGFEQDRQFWDAFTFMPDTVLFHEPSDGFTVIQGLFDSEIIRALGDTKESIESAADIIAKMTGGYFVASERFLFPKNEVDKAKEAALYHRPHKDMDKMFILGVPQNILFSHYGAFVIKCQGHFASPQDPRHVAAYWLSPQALDYAATNEAFYLWSYEKGFV